MPTNRAFTQIFKLQYLCLKILLLQLSWTNKLSLKGLHRIFNVGLVLQIGQLPKYLNCTDQWLKTLLLQQSWINEIRLNVQKRVYNVSLGLKEIIDNGVQLIELKRYTYNFTIAFCILHPVRILLLSWSAFDTRSVFYMIHLLSQRWPACW